VLPRTRFIARTAEQLRQLVGSRRCLLCANRCDELLCVACSQDLPWNRCACRVCARPLSAATIELCRYCARRALPFDAAVAAFRYASPIDRAVQALKYNADFLAARWLGDSLAEAVRSRGISAPDLLLSIPLHASRLRQRGYNQAHELARIVGRRLGVPVQAQLAQRSRATEDQIGKSAHERRRNLRGALVVDETVKNRNVALIDDVMTTGSTLAELARACRRSGAATVQAWVVARVE